MSCKQLITSGILPFFQDAYFQFALHSPTYGKIPPRYANYSCEKNFKRSGKQLLSRFIEAGGLRPSHKVLDVGCGMGNAALPLSEYLDEIGGGTYDGFDIMKRGVSWCRKKYRKYPNFRFIHANVYHPHYNPRGKTQATNFRFPYPANTFDLVVITSAFSHMMPNEIKSYLSEISRVMKFGAICFTKMFVLNDDVRRIMSESQKSAFTPTQKEIHDNYSVLLRNGTHMVMGFEQRYLEEIYGLMNLEIRKPFRYGSWSGRDTFYSFQDVVLAKKV